MNKKTGLMLISLLALFVLAGFGKTEVELLNTGKLIDLEKAIGLAKAGGSAGSLEEGSDASSETDPEAAEGEEPSGSGSTQGAVKDIVIRIRGEQIFYRYGSLTMGGFTATKLEDRLRSDFVSGAKVTLADDFAEAHVYKNVLGILDRLKNEMGLTYIETTASGGE